jgi:RIO kinase 1
VKEYERLENLERVFWDERADDRGRGTREERKTESEVWDRATLDVIYRLMKRGLVDTVEFPISTGKEGNVFYALTPKGLPIALKVYRTGTADFKSIARYIAGDPRFPDRRTTWARKEWLNLRLAHEAGVPVPEPLDQYRNVLAMAYIGTDDVPAPELRDVELEDPAAFLELVLDAAARLYQGASLVHGDLSEYNVLVHEGRPVLIDLGQAMLLKHPMAPELLERDCANISRYFRRLGVDTDAERVKLRITTPPEKGREVGDEGEAPKKSARRRAAARDGRARAGRLPGSSRRAKGKNGRADMEQGK